MRFWTMLRTVSILALAITAASAHHPFSRTYDADKFATLAGEVVKVQWTNPHVVLALEVERPDGTTERWLVEGLPPNTLRRQGWQSDSLREGTEIAVSGWYPRDATRKIFHGLEVTFQDGSKRLFGSSPATADLWRCNSGDCPEWLPSIAGE